MLQGMQDYNSDGSAYSSDELEYDEDLAREFSSNLSKTVSHPLPSFKSNPARNSDTRYGGPEDSDDGDDGEYGINRRRPPAAVFDPKGSDADPLLTSKSFSLSPAGAPDDDDYEGGDVLLRTSNLSASDSLWYRSYEFFVPPHLPRAVQLYHIDNLAIPACYLLVGVLQGLSGPLLNVLPLDIGATEAQQITISSLKSLPASFKLLFGFYSDGHTLFGYRRKSYMIIGWYMSALAMLLLGIHTPRGVWGDASQNQGGDANVAQNLTIPFVSAMTLLFGTGYWFADVMADSVVAEKAKLEPEETRGQLQSSCYACRFFGLMCAAPLSTYLYHACGPRTIMIMCGILPVMVMTPLISYFVEDYNPRVMTPSQQCTEIWSTVCSRAVWQPMGFVYLYNILQIGNAAWKEYLRSVLGFTSVQLNSLLVVAYVLLYAGILAYKYLFIRWSWRTIYIVTTVLNGVLSLGQIMLIKGMTLGLSNFVFALGDDAFADFIGGIQFLPTTIMMVHLCPPGSEGASYAMFTTVNNSAGSLAGAISTNILRFFDVKKETLIAGDLTDMTNLTILTTVLQTSGLLFVGLLPHTKDDLVKMSHGGSSRIGGGIFIAVTILSLMWTIVVNLLNVIAPGWAGES